MTMLYVLNYNLFLKYLNLFLGTIYTCVNQSTNMAA